MAKSRAVSIVPSARPPIPQAQGPSRAYVQVTLSSTSFERLDGKESTLFPLAPGHNDLAAIFEALTTATPALKDFFAIAIQSTERNEDFVTLMSLFGRIRPESEKLSLGDVVHARGRGDGKWAIVISANGRTIERAVTLDAAGSGTGTYVVGRLSGAIDFVWAPGAYTVLDPDAQIGRFWGPNLSVYRHVHYDFPDIVTVDQLIRDVFLGSRYDASSFDALLGEVGPTLYQIEAGMPLWPGSLLFTERDGEMAVMLAGSRVLRCRPRTGFEFAPLSAFKAAYVWYPQE